MSLIVWVCVSLLHGFDKDRAIPMAPFLSVAGVGTFVGSLYYPNIFHLLDYLMREGNEKNNLSII